MRLYSLIGAIAHEDPGYGHFEADPDDGSFDFPDDVSDVLATTGVKGRKLWETEEDRAGRLHGLEMARRRDPASMLSAMEENAALVRQLTELTAQLAAMQLAQGTPAAALPVPQPEPAGGDSAEAGDGGAPVSGGAPAKPARSPKPSAKQAAA
jgi:hypothetical protein